MPNTGRVNLIADYDDRVSRGVSGSQRALSSLESTVRSLGAAWGVREVVNYALELSKLAATSQMAEMSFRRIVTGAGRDFTETMRQMRAAVSGTLTDMQLMQKVGAAVDAGLTFNQSITALQFLRRYSLAFGKDFNQLVQTIFTGLQRGSVLFLDDAGIILSAQDAMFNGMGDLEKKTALVNRAVELMTEKMEMLPEPMENVITASGRLAAEWERLKIEGGKIYEGPLADIFSAATEAVRQFRGESQGTGISPLAGLMDLPEAMRNTRVEVDFLPQSLQAIIQSMDVWTTSIYDTTTATDNSAQSQREFLDRLNLTILANDRFLAQAAQRVGAEERIAEAVRKNKEETAQLYQELLKRQQFGQQTQMDVWRARIRFQKPAITQPASDAEIDASFDKYEGFLNELERMEAAASKDREKIIQAEYRQREMEIRKWAIDVKATEEEVNRMLEAYRAQRKETEKEAEIRHILLFFDADASNVKDASDLAAYSIGLLTEQLRGLDPTLASAINGIQQIVVGAKAGGFGGTAGIIAGSLGVLGSVVGVFQRKAAKAEAEARRLAQAIEAAGSASGSFAQQLESSSLFDLKRQFDALIRELRTELGPSGGQIFFEGFDFEGHAGKITANSQRISLELERVEESIRRFGGGAYTFSQAMENFNHQIRLEAIEDPTQKLARLSEVLRDVGVTITDPATFKDLTLREQYQITETIADIQRDITSQEIQVRKEQGNLIIASIREQADAIERTLQDAEEAQRRAVLRSVSLTFDIQEMALRQSYVPMLQGARTDPIERMRVIAEAQKEIELLQLAEEAAGRAELARLRESFENARQTNDRATELLIQATEQAAEQTGTDFRTAVEGQTQKLLAGFASEIDGTLLNKPIAPQDLIDLQKSVLLDMNAIINPVGVHLVDLATALRPYGVVDVDLRSALELQGVYIASIKDLLEVKGVKLVDLGQALSLSGQQVVDLTRALRTSGVVDVSLSGALKPIGAVDVSLSDALTPTGTRMVDLAQVLVPIGSVTIDLARAARLTGSLDIPAEFSAIAANLDLVNLNAFKTQYYLSDFRSIIEVQTRALQDSLRSIANALTAGGVGIDYGDPNWSFIRETLSDIRTNTYLSTLFEPQIRDELVNVQRYQSWALETQRALVSFGAYPGVTDVRNLMHFLNEPPVPALPSKAGGGAGGATQVTFAPSVPIHIDSISVSGDMDEEEVRDLFYDHLEDLIADSMVDGKIRQAFKQFLASVGQTTNVSTRV